MGTNYYFKVKNASEIVKQISAISSLISNDTLDRIKAELSYIHIGKSSGGWKPLFQTTNYYKNIEELKMFYANNKDNLQIIDEYETEITYDELSQYLIEWQPTGKSHVHEANIKGWNKDERYYKDEYGYEWLKSDFS